MGYRFLVRNSVPRLLICFVAAVVLALPAAASSPRQEQPLRVVTKPISPFVIEEPSGDLSGFSIDLWAALALQMQRPWEWVRVETVKDQLAAVEDGRADAAIAAISITEEREQNVDFSFSYFESGLGILTGAQNSMPVLDAIAMAFSPALLRLLAFVLALLIIVGHLVWFFERKHNPDFPKDYLHGIWAGMWYAGVTVTTVGYGDKTPKSIPGRLVGLIWMFVGLFVIANFTAGVTAQLALRELRGAINGPQDLPGKRIVAIEGTTGSQWLTSQGLPHMTVNTIDDAYAQLAAGPRRLLSTIILCCSIIRCMKDKTRLRWQADHSILKITASPYRLVARCVRKSTRAPQAEREWHLRRHLHALVRHRSRSLTG